MSAASTPDRALDRAPEARRILPLMADWWARPDQGRIALWCSASYAEDVTRLWLAALGGDAADRVSRLLSALLTERDRLIEEYERLFVGPARLPCPPYEAVWRRDRPRIEQGTINGSVTEELKRVYRELGLQLRSGEVELADHIAVELEALAYAIDVDADPVAIGWLQDRLASWVPAFCGAVAANARCDAYRFLAEVTNECVGHGPATVQEPR